MGSVFSRAGCWASRAGSAPDPGPCTRVGLSMCSGAATLLLSCASGSSLAQLALLFP